MQLQQAGMSPTDAAAWMAAQLPQPEQGEGSATAPFEVWPENWPALDLFLRLQTQWVRDWQGRREGLRYEAVQAALAMKQVSDTATMFDALVDMEHAALEVFNGV